MRTVVLAMLLLSPVLAMSNQSGDDVGEKCEEKWVRLSGDMAAGQGTNYPELLKQWQAEAKECGGAVAYQARLAMAHVLVGEVGKARSVLAPLVGVKSKHAHLVEFASVLARQKELSQAEEPTLADVQGIEADLGRIVGRYPGFAEAYGLLGAVQGTLGKHEAAIASLQRGLRSRMNLAGVHRNLTVSLQAVGRDQEAIAAADQAVRHNRFLTSDPYFVMALARAHAGVGKFDSADLFMKVILTKIPQLQADPEFRGTLRYLKDKRLEAGVESSEPKR